MTKVCANVGCLTEEKERSNRRCSDVMEIRKSAFCWGFQSEHGYVKIIVISLLSINMHLSRENIPLKLTIQKKKKKKTESIKS